MNDARILMVAVVGAGLGLVLWKAFSDAQKARNESMSQSVGRGAVEAAVDVIKGAGQAVIDATAGAGKAVEQAVWNSSKCAKAMREGDAAGVMWECDPATGVEWLLSGRPTNCNALPGGAVLCQKQAKQRGATGEW